MYLSKSNIDCIDFPDGQPHIKLPAITTPDAHLTWRVRNATELLQVAEISNALNGLAIEKKILYIPYLMGARYDRRMYHGDSCDLRVIADIINSCGFKRVELLDVHSDVALQLIDNSVNRTNRALVRAYTLPESVLICPDAGAVKKVGQLLDWNSNLTDVVYCLKSRAANGKVSLKVVEPERCKNRQTIVVDDLCDGGATFIEIAKQIEPSFLTLIVTHNVFSKGVELLLEHYDRIITSDSYRELPPHKDVLTIKV